MRRGTTPTIIISTDVDLTAYDKVILTLRDDKGYQFDAVDIAVEASRITATLTQSETLSLKAGSVKAQIRAVNAEGQAIASNIMDAWVENVLKEGEITVD